MNAQAQTTPPKIGDYWPGQGGIYAGIIRDPATKQQWHLIMHEQEITSTEWGGYGHAINANSYYDGLANTTAMKAMEVTGLHFPILKHISNLHIDGHSDFYLPAQRELNLLFINLNDLCGKVFHWSSTQCSADCAWLQGFEQGRQRISLKDSSLAAPAVRRLPIQ